MKRIIAITTFFATAAVAYAIFTAEFSGWDELIEQSPNIFIAKCTATPHPMAIVDDVITSDVEVQLSLKGDTKLGPSHLHSFYWPHQDELLLVFPRNSYSDPFGTGYNAIENYRVVLISPGFSPRALTGMPLRAQIRMILQNRLGKLSEELAKGQEEKKRLEDGLKELEK